MKYIAMLYFSYLNFTTTLCHSLKYLRVRSLFSFIYHYLHNLPNTLTRGSFSTISHRVISGYIYITKSFNDFDCCCHLMGLVNDQHQARPWISFLLCALLLINKWKSMAFGFASAISGAFFFPLNLFRCLSMLSLLRLRK